MMSDHFVELRLGSFLNNVLGGRVRCLTKARQVLLVNLEGFMSYRFLSAANRLCSKEAERAKYFPQWRGAQPLGKYGLP